MTSYDDDTKPKSRAPTGMSGMIGDEEEDSDDQFDPVYLPDNFKKPRDEKLNEQSRVLQRLQGLM